MWRKMLMTVKPNRLLRRQHRFSASVWNEGTLPSRDGGLVIESRLRGNPSQNLSFLDRRFTTAASSSMTDEIASQLKDSFESKSPNSPMLADSLINELNVRRIPLDADVLYWAIQCWSRTKRKDAAERIEKLYQNYWDCTVGSISSSSGVGDATELTASQEEKVQTALLCLLQAYHNISNAHRAEELLLNLAEDYDTHERVRPSLEMCKTVLSTWTRSASSNRGNRAQKLLSLMEKDATLPDPDITCYTFVLSCWASSNKDDAPHRAELFLRRMEINDPPTQPNIMSYTCLLTAWSRSNADNAPKEAECLLEEIRDKFAPDRRVYTAMISVWGRSRQQDGIEQAERYLQELIDLQEQNSQTNESHDTDIPKATVVEYTALIQSWANHVSDHPANYRRAMGRVEELFQLLLDSDDEDLRPNRMTFAAVLRAIGAAQRVPDRYARATAVLRTMEEMNMDPTNYILNLHQKCAKGGPSSRSENRKPKRNRQGGSLRSY